MDRIGTIMGVVTIPMAALTAASVPAGLWLLGAGPARPALLGIVALGVGLGLAWLLERAVAMLDEAAVAMRRRHGPGAGRVVGLVCGIVPMIVLLAWEYVAARAIIRFDDPRIAIATWLWSYGVATGPWTLFAQLIGSDRRTLCGIRAYSGHLGYWLLSAALLAGAPASIAIVLMALPAVLPVTVGTLLAVADREALRNVRI